MSSASFQIVGDLFEAGYLLRPNGAYHSEPRGGLPLAPQRGPPQRAERRSTSCAPTGPTTPAQGNALGLAEDKEWSPEGATQGGTLIPDVSFIEINSVSHQEGSVFVLE
jgi:hypothetical protein